MEYKRQPTPASFLLPGVTKQQLNKWTAKHDLIHIISLEHVENEFITGYFKNPEKDIEAKYIALVNNNMLHEAGEFLLNNTFIGGDKRIVTHLYAVQLAQSKLWLAINLEQYRQRKLKHNKFYNEN